MDLQVESWPVERLNPYGANARQHSAAQVKQIAASLREFGFNVPCLVDDKGELIAGHGRLLAAKELNLKSVPVIRLSHLTPLQAKAFRLAENQLALNSEWDLALLQAELKALDEANFTLEVIGFDDKELAELEAATAEEDLSELEAKSALLELVEISMAEPRHVLERGDHYTLADRHHLICDSVISGWAQWAPLLRENSLFCGYAGVFVPFSKMAGAHELVMVQPDSFIAGHILDRYEEVHPNSVKRA